jgi:hypothetical protein
VGGDFQDGTSDWLRSTTGLSRSTIASGVEARYFPGHGGQFVADAAIVEIFDSHPTRDIEVVTTL